MTDCTQSYQFNYAMYDVKSPAQHSNLSSACSHDSLSCYSAYSPVDPMVHHQNQPSTPEQKSDHVHFQSLTNEQNYSPPKHSYQPSPQIVHSHHHNHIPHHNLPSQQPQLAHQPQTKPIKTDQPLQLLNNLDQPLIGSLPPQFSPTEPSESSSPFFECSQIPSFFSFVRPNVLRASRQHQQAQRHHHHLHHQQQQQPPNTFPPLPLQLQQQNQQQTSSIETVHYNPVSISQQQQIVLPQNTSPCQINHQPLQHAHPHQQQVSSPQNQFRVHHSTLQPTRHFSQQSDAAFTPIEKVGGQETNSSSLVASPTPPPHPLASVVKAITDACQSPKSIDSDTNISTDFQKSPHNLPPSGMQLLRTRRHNSSKGKLSNSGRLSSQSLKNGFKSEGGCDVGDEDTLCQNSPVVRRNERERNRVSNVNKGFQDLRGKIPKVITKKLSKVETLRIAIKYIHYLQNALEGRLAKKNFLSYLEDPEFINVRPMLNCSSPCFEDSQQ